MPPLDSYGIIYNEQLCCFFNTISEVTFLRIAICDDDALSLQSVTAIVNEFAADRGISVSTYSQSTKLLEDALQLGGFDLYILDILMPILSGIQLSGELRRTGLSGRILFLTSSQDFAIDAFRVQASGYLLKPVQKPELLQALTESFAAISAVKHLSLIVKTRENNVWLDFDRILYVELVRKTVVYHLIDGKTLESISIRSTFSEAIQPLLRDRRFILCGSAKVGNLHYVSQLDAENLFFRNGTSLYIGRRSGRELRSAWYDFWFNGEEST